MITEKGNWILGIDPGTNSTGICTLKNNEGIYTVDTYQSVLYPRADRCADRRSHRSSRNNHIRCQKRKNELNRIFKNEIRKVDKDFFIKFKQQSYRECDKLNRIQNFELFDYDDYSNKEFLKSYPTINHLIMDIIHDTVKKDKYYILKVYYCLYYFMQKRGHFNLIGISEENTTDTLKIFEQLSFISDDLSIDWLTDRSIFEDIYFNHSKKRLEKLKELKTMNFCNSRQKEEIIKALLSMNFKMKYFFSDVDGSLNFKDSKIDEQLEDLKGFLSDDEFEFIEVLKIYHDSLIIADLLKNYNYLSELRISIYNKFHDDLKNLKYIMHLYENNKDYTLFFRKDNKSGYAGIFGKNRNDIIKYIKLKLELYSSYEISEEQKELISKMLSDIENDNFLNTINSSANSYIPMQLHLKEVKAILNQAKKYLPFLNEITDHSEYTNKEKIISLFSYKTPYYLGRDNHFEWELTEDIYCNVQKEYMNHLISKCTYFIDRPVLPRRSLLYEKYCVLNEINNIKINGRLISVELKQDIFNNLYKTKKSVTLNSIKKYLLVNHVITETDIISGLPNSLSCLNTYHKLNSIFNLENEIEYNRAENIVLLKTIYGKEIQNFINACKKENYTDEEIEKIKSISFEGWGKLSKELLTCKAYSLKTNEEITLIDALWMTNYNFNELIYSSDYTFSEKINTNYKFLENKNIFNIKYEDIAHFQYTNDVNRMLWINIKLIKDEIIKNNSFPQSIFIESPRGIDGSSDNKEDRYKKISDIYKNILSSLNKKDPKYLEIKHLQDELEHYKEIIKISQKVYLYFLQCGREFYGNGEKLCINDIKLYQKDHIVPNSVIHSNELSDLVLTKEIYNESKGANYPLSIAQKNPNFFITKEAKDNWYFCFKYGLIDDIKYNRLMRTEELTPDDITKFKNNQLVSTSQATKYIFTILNYLLADTNVKFVKASKVSNFRKEYRFIKDREINHFHHAEDAVLIAILGNNIYQDPYFDGRKNIYSNGCKTWDKEKSIISIKNIFNKNAKVITKVYNPSGSLYDMSIIKNNDQNMTAPIKRSGPLSNKEYGVRSSLKTAGACYITHEEKGQLKHTYVRIPLIQYQDFKNLGAKQFCENLGYYNVSVIRPFVRINDIIYYNQYPYRFGGFTKNRIILKSAAEYRFPNNLKPYISEIKRVTNYLDYPVDLNDADKKMLIKNKEYPYPFKKDNNITKEKNLEVYKLLIYEFSEGFFKNKINNPIQKLIENYDHFMNLNLVEQTMQLAALLHLVSSDNFHKLDKICKNKKGLDLNILEICSTSTSICASWN